MTLVDTNVVLDVLTNDRVWAEWSIANLRRQMASGPLVINEVVYAELAGNGPTEAELKESVRLLRLQLDRTPETALFLAGAAFRQYRRSGGVRTGVLPDFFIGAHAQVARLPILTRDVKRFRTYFPQVTLIAPEG